MNNVCIMGRLTGDPELKKTASGTSVCSFTVAVNRKVKSGEDSKADFVDCVAWRGTAEFASKWFSKGEMIALRGRLQTRTYEDKNGFNRKVVEVIAEEVNFCGGKRKSKEAEAESSFDDEVEIIDLPEDEELPF